VEALAKEAFRLPLSAFLLSAFPQYVKDPPAGLTPSGAGLPGQEI
jgi:hypothetical protein